MTELHTPDGAPHGDILNTLARADSAGLKAFAESLIPQLGEISVQKNRSGLVMLPMQDTAQGTNFHLGEVLVSEAHVLAGGQEGYGMRRGRDLEAAMAMALATRPEILILDEPTAGVDPIARREILQLMRRVADEDGGTVLFSTHNIHEVGQIADVVGVLHDGALAYQGPVGDFVEHVRGATEAELPDASLEEAFVALVGAQV